MSIKIMSHVWENSVHKGSALLLLLAIADMANDDGECYPGIQRLARKTRMTDRNVQINLKVLTKSGELEIDYNQGVHTKTGYTNLYIVDFPERGERVKLRGQGVKNISPLSGKGVKSISPLGVKSISPESSVEPSVKEESLDIAPAAQDAHNTPAKAKSPKKQNPMYDVIFDIWGYIGARNGDYQKFLLNKATKAPYQACNVNPPVHPPELRAWANWYRGKHQHGDFIMLESPAKIQSSIAEFRREPKPLHEYYADVQPELFTDDEQPPAPSLSDLMRQAGYEV